MAQTTISIRMDEELKRKMEELCSDLGMTLTTAITIFAKKATREHRIPFDVSADPIYREVLTAEELDRRIKAVKEGHYAEHELIEVDT